MKITRNILGTDVEIELTPFELMNASREYDTKCCIEDIQSRYKVDNLSQEKLEDLEYTFRNALDDCDSYWEAYWDSLRYVMESEDIEERDEYEY